MVMVMVMVLVLVLVFYLKREFCFVCFDYSLAYFLVWMDGY